MVLSFTLNVKPFVVKNIPQEEVRNINLVHVLVLVQTENLFLHTMIMIMILNKSKFICKSVCKNWLKLNC